MEGGNGLQITTYETKDMVGVQINLYLKDPQASPSLTHPPTLRFAFYSLHQFVLPLYAREMASQMLSRFPIYIPNNVRIQWETGVSSIFTRRATAALEAGFTGVVGNIVVDAVTPLSLPPRLPLRASHEGS